MTALYVPPSQPLVDPQTGLCDRVWYRFFQRLFVTVGEGAVTEEMSFSISPVAADFSAQINQIGGDLSAVAQAPQTQTLYFAADDVMPVLSGLRDQIAMLRLEIDDLRKGTLL